MTSSVVDAAVPMAAPAPSAVVQSVDLPDAATAPDASPTSAFVPRPPCTACPNLTLVFVVDHSRALTKPYWEPMKTAIARSVTALAKSDNVGIVTTFGGAPIWAVPLGKLDTKAVSEALTPWPLGGGGFEYLIALDIAYTDLIVVRTRRAHVLLMGNGQAPQAGMKELAYAMAAEGISLSTLGVGPSIDARFLQMLADIGGGHFYDGSDPTKLTALVRSDVETQLTP